MDKKLGISLVVLIIVILGATALYQYRQNNSEQIIDYGNGIVDDYIRPTETINANYQYRDGEHVFVGNLTLPTPCHTYNAEVVKNENVIEIKITTEASEEMCAQVITERQFRVSFEAPEDQLIIASINGEIVNLNLFEVPEDENIDDVEVFIKG